MTRLITLCLLLLSSADLSGQTARVEADHVFVFVSRGGEAEADALRQLGFAVGSGVTKHIGQGTASRSVYFGNAYFEMIWVDSTVAISEDTREAAGEMHRVAAWRTTGVSPFGLGLRHLEGPDEYGVPATRFSAEWMEPGSAIVLLNQSAEQFAFKVFVVPNYMAVPAWVGELEQEAPALLQHSNGARRITGIEIRGPVTQHARAARTLSIPGFRLHEANDPMLVIELDERAAGVTHDLRPLMPVTIHR